MLTFLTVIEKLMEDEGIEPDADLDDARMMDEELVYIVHFCRENGILICQWVDPIGQLIHIGFRTGNFLKFCHGILSLSLAGPPVLRLVWILFSPV